MEYDATIQWNIVQQYGKKYSYIFIQVGLEETRLVKGV